MTVNNKPIQKEKTQTCTNTQKWYTNIEKRKRKKKTRTVVPIKMVSVFVVHDANINGDECRGKRRQHRFEDNYDDEASISSNFSNTAACCGDTAESYYV